MLATLASCQTNGQQKSKSKPKITDAALEVHASEITQSIPDKTYSGVAPGTVAPDAVEIDADAIESMVNGVCIITKGNLHAIVDLKGNFIKNWDNYKYASSAPFSTLISISTPFGCGFINVKGETVIQIIYGKVGSFDPQKTVSVLRKGDPIPVQIDNKGRVITKLSVTEFTNPNQRNEYNRPQSGLINFFQPGIGKGFMNKSGKVVIAPQASLNYPFTDGLCVVGAIDQFSHVKWGYMNESGRMVIPLTFSKQPSPFHDGFAVVFPTERITFNYAYIDKTGKVRFTVGNGQQFQPYHTKGDAGGGFINGYAFWEYGDNEYRLLDTLGNMHNPTEIIRHPELEYKGQIGVDDYTEQGIFVYNYKAGYLSSTHGLVDLNGQYLFPPVFYHITPDYFSPYALATKNIPGQNGTMVHLQGVVNRQGVFVLILKQKSLF